MSPDGAQVAFVRVDVNAKKDGYDTSLWIVPAAGGSEPRKLTAGPRDASPRWSPDGKTLAFVRAPEEGGRPQPGQVFVLSMSGGEARQVTKLPRGAGNPIWSPDGKTIAFTNTSSAKDLEKPGPAGNPPGDTSDPAAEQARRTSDVRVITRAVYRGNGAGYLDPTRKTTIWTIAVDEALAGSAQAVEGDRQRVRLESRGMVSRWTRAVPDREPRRRAVLRARRTPTSIACRRLRRMRRRCGW